MESHRVSAGGGAGLGQAVGVGAGLDDVAAGGEGSTIAAHRRGSVKVLVQPRRTRWRRPPRWPGSPIQVLSPWQKTPHSGPMTMAGNSSLRRYPGSSEGIVMRSPTRDRLCPLRVRTCRWAAIRLRPLILADGRPARQVSKRGLSDPHRACHSGFPRSRRCCRRRRRLRSRRCSTGLTRCGTSSYYRRRP
jgi:hypothetical protein